VTHIFWNGSSWVRRVIENSGLSGHSVSMAMDSNDQVHASFYDSRYQDLRYVTWGSEFASITVDGLASVQSTALGIRNGVPTIGYHDLITGSVKVAEWDEDWSSTSIGTSSSPIQGISAAALHNRQHLSHYDADNQRLLYTQWDGEIRRSVVVDEVGDVGRFNDIAFAGFDDRFVRIAYWDATNQWIRLAELNGFDPPVIHVNTQAPTLNADSGYVSIAPLPDENVGISYYDGVNGDLRLSTWDPATNTWDDRLVDGAAADVGQINDIQFDGTEGVPVLAYYDQTNDKIMLAYENMGAFQTGIAAPNAGGVTSLSLELNLNSRKHARILYTTADNNLNLATLKNGSWRVTNVVSGGASAITAASSALQNQLHFAYADSFNGLVYGSRTTNLEFAELPGEPPTLGDGFYNPMDGCIAFFNFIFGGNDDDRNLHPTGYLGRQAASRSPLQLANPLTDFDIFADMASLFNLSQGGQFYIDLYQNHGSEMGQIGLEDPILLWDSFGTLQNFMPGLEALVTGRGDEFLVSQEMVDDALNIWQRLTDDASPELATGINTELAKYNNLQDFVGMSFDEWAQALGVEPLNKNLFMPSIFVAP
jgi:hypothetical protein